MIKEKTRRSFIKTSVGASIGLSIAPAILLSKQVQRTITPNDVIKWLEGRKGWTITHEEGIHHGSSNIEIKGITVCWKASPQAIKEAGERGDNLLIGHETLYYPYYSDFDPERTKGWQEWKVNTQRKELLNNYNLTFLRLHSTLDKLYIAEEIGKWLELGETEEKKVSGYNYIYEIEECTLEELVAKVKRLSGMSALRVSAPKGLQTKVKRVGILVGGAALVANGGAFEPGVRSDIDVFIAGETDNYGFRYASEMGISLIETSHEVNENPGLKHFTEDLKKQYPDIRVTFYENKCAYRVV